MPVEHCEAVKITIDTIDLLIRIVNISKTKPFRVANRTTY